MVHWCRTATERTESGFDELNALEFRAQQSTICLTRLRSTH